MHRVTFRDEAEKGVPLADVVIVESYKKYNQYDEDDALSSCKCALL